MRSDLWDSSLYVLDIACTIWRTSYCKCKKSATAELERRHWQWHLGWFSSALQSTWSLIIKVNKCLQFFIHLACAPNNVKFYPMAMWGLWVVAQCRVYGTDGILVAPRHFQIHHFTVCHHPTVLHTPTKKWGVWMAAWLWHVWQPRALPALPLGGRVTGVQAVMVIECIYFQSKAGFRKWD